MSKKVILDEFESDIEDSFESLVQIDNLDHEMSLLRDAASRHVKKKRSITIRISELDLKVVQFKASKLGIPYQTYINMLIHKDAIGV